MRGSLQILFVLAVTLAIVPVAVLGQTNNQNGNQSGWGSHPNATQGATPVHHGWGPNHTIAQNVPPSNPAPRPGWAEGRKVGWGGNNPPPGQAKRDEHHYYRHHHYERHHHWDRDHDRFRHEHERHEEHEHHHDHDRH